MKSGVLERGDFTNKDTGIVVNFGSVGIRDSVTFAEIQALAAGNQDVKDLIDTERDLAEYKILRRDYKEQLSRMISQSETLPDKIADCERAVLLIRADTEEAGKMGEITHITKPGGGVLSESVDMNRYLLGKANEAISKSKKGDNEPVLVCTVYGFEVYAVAEKMSLDFYDKNTTTVAKFLIQGEYEYRIDAGHNDNDRNLQRLDNFFKSLSGRLQTAESELEKHRTNLEQAKEFISKPFEYEEKIKELETRFEELSVKLSGVQDDAIIDPEEDGFAETAEEKEVREKIYGTDENDYQPVPEDDAPDIPLGGRRR
jgi:hypothetical protein